MTTAMTTTSTPPRGPVSAPNPPLRHLGDVNRRSVASRLLTAWLIRRGAVAGFAVLVVALIAVVVGLPWWAVAALVVVLAGAVAAWVLQLKRRDPLNVVLDFLGGVRPADVHRDARLVNMVENLAFVVGAPLPDVVVIESAAANAMVAQGSGRAVLAASEGLVDQLGLMELEGVVAILLARLRHGDAVLATTALACVAPSRQADTLGSGRIIGFDLEGARLTRYPPALARAFERLSTVSTDVAAPSELDEFWLVPPARCGHHESPDIRAAVMYEL